jgi:hypothetical protein
VRALKLTGESMLLNVMINCGLDNNPAVNILFPGPTVVRCAADIAFLWGDLRREEGPGGR